MGQINTNLFICLTKNCPHSTKLFQNINQHPQHNLVNIKTLKQQLDDPQHPMNKFIQIKRDQIMIDIDAKIQELQSYAGALINEFENTMRKLANETINQYDNQVFLINGVKNLEAQIIAENSQSISKLFSLDYKEIQQNVNETVNMKRRVSESTEMLKQQMKKLFHSVDLTFNKQEIFEFKWSQSMMHKKIVIKEQTAMYGEYDGYWHQILLEPRIDFTSTQTCRLKFEGGDGGLQYFIFPFILLTRNAAIRLVDYKIQREKNPDFTSNYYGQYVIYNDGGVSQNNIFLNYKSFEFNKNDLIEVNWDGPRSVLGIKKIGSEQKHLQFLYLQIPRFEIKVENNEDSQLYLGVMLIRVNCSIG